MIDRKCFTEKELVGYGNMDEGKKTWMPTYDYFTDLYETRTSLLEDFGAHSNYGSATSTNDRRPPRPPERTPEITGRSIGGSVGPPETNSKWEELNTYVGEMEETAEEAKEFAASVSMSQTAY